jgi:uncharacterized protein YfaT (DUF1175 family)
VKTEALSVHLNIFLDLRFIYHTTAATGHTGKFCITKHINKIN